MGEVDSTTNVGNAEVRTFNSCHKNNFEPLLEDMTEDYVYWYNIKFLLSY